MMYRLRVPIIDAFNRQRLCQGSLYGLFTKLHFIELMAVVFIIFWPPQKNIWVELFI